MITKRSFLSSLAAAAAIPAGLTNAGSARAQATGARPGLIAAKDIAEAGLIYGLPIVMNYAVMYEFVIDKGSDQYKAPFNIIKNEFERLHLQGYGCHHTQQRHALFSALARSPCRTHGDLGSAD